MFQLTPRVWEHLQCEVLTRTLYELELRIAQAIIEVTVCAQGPP